MVVFDTDPSQARRSGIIALSVCAVLAVLCLAGMALLPLTLLTVILAVFTLGFAALAVWVWFHIQGLTNTSYALDRNAFVIRYGPISQVLPMGEVQDVIPASQIASTLRLRRPPLPGWWIGKGRAEGLPPIHFYANAPLEEQHIVITPQAAYAISPYDAETFVDAFHARHEMRPTQDVQHTQVLPPFLQWAFWKDSLAQGLLIAVALGVLALFGLSAGRYPALGKAIPLHFDVAGAVDRLAPAAQIFTPALFGFGVIALNVMIGVLLYRRGERAAAYLAWGGGVLVAMGFAVAILTIGFRST